ncbi:LOW QUALITY PROTEIN: splicing factor U2AF 35 kDa subunit [Aegotheles albertisi]
MPVPIRSSVRKAVPAAPLELCYCSILSDIMRCMPIQQARNSCTALIFHSKNKQNSPESARVGSTVGKCIVRYFFLFQVRVQKDKSTVHFISKLELVVMETDVLGCTTNQHLARKRCCCKLACSRDHPVLTFRQLDFKKNGTNTILIQNIYRNPQNSAQTADGSHCAVSDVEMQEHYDEFFEEVFTEMEEKYGEVEEMNVCDNLGDHLVGNVYVKFRREEDAEKAVIDLNNRWFNGQPIHAELSPVTDFREACCRQYEMGECTRGGFCNFMHLKPISRELRRELYGRRRKKHRSRSRSRERRSRSRDRGRGGGGGGGGGRERDRRRSRDRERSGRF